MVVILGQGDAEREGRFLKNIPTASVDLVKSFIADGVDVNARDENGQSALHLAAAAGRLDTLRFLCKETDAEVDGRDAKGKTPLMAAFENQRVTSAKFLIEKAGADPQAKDAEGHGIAEHLFDSQKVRQELAGDDLVWLAIKHVDDLEGKLDRSGRANLHKLLAMPDISNLELMLVAGLDPHQGRPRNILMAGDKSPSHPYAPPYVALEQILNNRFGDSQAKNIVQVFRELPRVPDDLSSMTKDELVQVDEKGHRLLDNPLLWKRMPEVIASLEAKGESLPSRADLTSGGIMGHSPLSIALHTRSLDAAEHCLASHGEGITAADFGNSQNSGLSKFGVAAVEMDLLNERIMTFDRWEGKLGEMKKFHQELPQKARDSINGYQQLVQQVRATMPQMQHGR